MHTCVVSVLACLSLPSHPPAPPPYTAPPPLPPTHITLIRRACVRACAHIHTYTHVHTHTLNTHIHTYAHKQRTHNNTHIHTHIHTTAWSTSRWTHQRCTRASTVFCVCRILSFFALDSPAMHTRKCCFFFVFTCGIFLCTGISVFFVVGIFSSKKSSEKICFGLRLLVHV
jgi:hypothetical protein